MSLRHYFISTSNWRWLMLGVLLLTTFYGAYRLDADSLWVDEVISMQRSGLVSYVESTAPSEVWQRTALISDQVPGYYILLALWGNVVGTTPFALRSLSLLFGVLSVAVVYQIGKSLYSQYAGISTALMLASNAFYMLFLHEMRAYAFLVFLIAIFIWCYWLVTHDRASLWSQMGLVLSATAMMYSYYLSIVVIVSVCLYHLIFLKKDREWWRVVILMGCAGVLFLPWFITAFSVFDDTVRNDMRTIHTTDFFTAISTMVEAFSNKNSLFLILLLLSASQLRRDATRFAWFLCIACLSLMIMLNEPFGVFVNLRYTLIIWIPLSILAGLGLQRLIALGVPSVLVLGVILTGGLIRNFNDSLEADYDLPIRYLPWDTLTETLTPYEQDGDTMTFIASIEGNDWEGVHEERVMPHYFHDSMIEPMFIEDVRNLSDEAFLLDATHAAQNSERIWLSYDPNLRSWRTGLFEDRLLENNFNFCGNFVDTDELYLDLYAHPNTVANSDTFTFVQADSSAELALIGTIPSSPDSMLHITHAWTLSDDFPRSEYSLAVHIMDAQGNLVTQADYGLPTDPFDCVQVDILLDTLSEGRYEIRAFVYQWQDGTRLSLTEDTSQTLVYPIKQIIDIGGHVITQPLFNSFMRPCECLIQQLQLMDTYIDGYHIRDYALVIRQSATQGNNDISDYIVIGEFIVE